MRLPAITIALTLAIGLFLIVADGPGLLVAAALPVFISLLGLARQHWLRSAGAALMLAIMLLSLGRLYFPIVILMSVQVFTELPKKENYA
jgi:hypothetical protein